MNNNPNQERLRQFFGAYFHQDWEDDTENPRDVVLEYMKIATENDRRVLSKAILDYASQFEDYSELEEKLSSELWCEYLPSADGLTAREWLLSVAAQLLENQE